MVNLIQTLAILFLELLGRYDKAKQQKIITDFHNRLDADPCGVLVEQLGGNGGASASATTHNRADTDA